MLRHVSISAYALSKRWQSKKVLDLWLIFRIRQSIQQQTETDDNRNSEHLKYM